MQWRQEVKEYMEVYCSGRIENPAGPKVDRLIRRMVGPLTGLDKTISYSLHDPGSPHLYIVVAQLTAVHRMIGLGHPLSYHLGGYGVTREEAFMRALGETVERYAHMVYLLENGGSIQFARQRDLAKQNAGVWNPEDSQFYDQEQISRPAFPFRSYSSDHPLGWVEVLDLTSGKPVLAPAQLLVVGYMLRVDEGEDHTN